MEYNNEDIIKKLDLLETILREDRNRLAEGLAEISNNRKLIENLKDRLTTIINQQEIIKNTIEEVDQLQKVVLNEEIKSRVFRIEDLLDKELKCDIALQTLIEQKSNLFENLHKQKKAITIKNRLIRVLILASFYLLFAVDAGISKDYINNATEFHVKRKEIPEYMNFAFAGALFAVLLDKEQFENIVSASKNVIK